MDLLLWSTIFIVALGLLIKSSDYFIDASQEIGVYFKLSPVVIGTLILALGTSLPELVTSVLSVFKNESEIVLGNVIGSNIANTCLIFGIILLMKPDRDSLKFPSFKVDNWTVLAVTAFLIYAISDGVISSIESGIFIACFLLYVIYTIRSSNPEEMLDVDIKDTDQFPGKYLVFLILSGIGIYFGADYTIQAIVEISKILGIGKDIIAVTVVALGTSLPELVVSLMAAKKGSMEMAVGNVLGSSIFNILCVAGISSLLGPVIVSKNIHFPGVPFLALVTAFSFLIILINRPSKFFGALFLVFYFLFNFEIVFRVLADYLEK